MNLLMKGVYKTIFTDTFQRFAKKTVRIGVALDKRSLICLKGEMNYTLDYY